MLFPIKVLLSIKGKNDFCSCLNRTSKKTKKNKGRLKHCGAVLMDRGGVPAKGGVYAVAVGVYCMVSLSNSFSYREK